MLSTGIPVPKSWVAAAWAIDKPINTAHRTDYTCVPVHFGVCSAYPAFLARPMAASGASVIHLHCTLREKLASPAADGCPLVLDHLNLLTAGPSYFSGSTRLRNWEWPQVASHRPFEMRREVACVCIQYLACAGRPVGCLPSAQWSMAWATVSETLCSHF